MKVLLGTLVVLAILLPIQGKVINWSGYSWMVRNQTSSGPGPNLWSDANAFLDVDGNLHLKITHTSQGWQCVELTSELTFPPSNFQWQVASRVDQLDRNVVVGLFMYPPNGLAPDGTNEIDIEFAQWADPNNQRLFYTLFPKDSQLPHVSAALEMNNLPGPSTHRFKWNTTSIYYQSLRGYQPRDSSSDTFASWITPAKYINEVPTMNLSVHMNVWLFQGKPPTDSNEVEVVLKSFEHW